MFHFPSNFVNTGRVANKQTNADENITSLADVTNTVSNLGFPEPENPRNLDICQTQTMA